MGRRPEPAEPRDATPADLVEIREIYAHHVMHGLASFEEEPPGLEEIGRRFAETRRLGLPYLVVQTPEGIAGFAYARPYRPRPAYRFSVEDSVYLRPGFERRGFGRRLLAALIEACTAAGYRQMIAVIGDSGNLPSICLHKALGFREVGTIASVGFKLGRWVDSVVLQLPLGEGDGSLPPR